MSGTSHRLVEVPALGPASGFSHAVVAAPGRLVHLAGQVGLEPDGGMAEDYAAQLGTALGRLVVALAAAGGAPGDVVAMTIFTTRIEEYRQRRRELGEVYRAHFGRHFPAMTLVGVSELVDIGAVVEVNAVAVIPGEAKVRTEPQR